MVLAVTHPIHLNAQVYINTEWVQTTGSPDNIPWTYNTLDPFGELVVVGNTQISPGHTQVLTTKYDERGNMIWQQTWSAMTGTNNYGVSALTDAEGNVYVAATVTNVGSQLDFALLKYRVDGVLEWVATWDGPASLDDIPAAMALNSSGEVFLAGTTWTDPLYTDFALVKIDGGGQVSWSVTYDHAGLIDAGVAVELDQNGHPVISGVSAPSLLTWEMATLRFDTSTGNGMDTLRVQIPGLGLQEARAMAIDGSGNIYVTGNFHDGQQRDVQTLKIGSGFTMTWLENWDHAGKDDNGLAVAADSFGNVYVAGLAGNPSGGSEFLTLKYGPDGDLLWSRLFQPRDSTWAAMATGLAVSDDGVLVTGTVHTTVGMSFATVKYASNGKLVWSKTHATPQQDGKAMALALGTQGQVYVSGIFEGSAGNSYATIKYDVYTKDNDAVLDSLGNPLYKDNEIIVKFKPHLVDTNVVDNLNWQHGTLDLIVPDSVAQAVAAKLGLPQGAEQRLKVMKVYRNWTRADSISISRLGEEVRMPKVWSSFILETDALGLAPACDSLSSLHASISYAHPNLLFQFYSNDPIYDEDWQSSLSPTTTYPDAHINIEPAWAIQTGQPFIKVGIVDTPIKWDHEDFVHDGQTKILSGRDYHQQAGDINTSLPYPYGSEGYHGTACASIVGALRNNSKGVAGIAGGDVEGTGNTGTAIVPLVVGAFITQYIGVEEAAPAILEGSSDIPATGNGFGCHVLNMSWGSAATGLQQTYPMAMVEAMLAANRNHCVITAAHGNYGVGQSNFRSYPSAFADHPDGPHSMVGDNVVLSIGASGDDGRHLYFESNNTDGYGFNACHHFGVDIVAPGSSSNVYTALGGLEPGLNCQNLPWDTFGFPQLYSCFQGTSSAAPHVAGVVALMMAEHSVINGAPNGLAPEDVEHILQHTATDIFDLVTGWPPYNEYFVGYDNYHGHGRMDAGSALALVSAPYCIVHSGTPVSSSSQQFSTEVITVAYRNLLELPPGEYNAYRVAVTHTYIDELAPAAEIIDDGSGAWGRESSTIGTHDVNWTVNGRTWATYDFDINGNTAAVTATTNTWFIQNSTDNSVVVNEWFPAPPADLRTAYSLLVLNGDCWGPSTVGLTEVTPEHGITVYPNPAHDLLTIDLGELAGTGWELRIIDALGRTVAFDVVGQQATIRMPVGHLRPGTYCVLLFRNEEVHARRFIKLH